MQNYNSDFRFIINRKCKRLIRVSSGNFYILPLLSNKPHYYHNYMYSMLYMIATRIIFWETTIMVFHLISPFMTEWYFEGFVNMQTSGK